MVDHIDAWRKDDIKKAKALWPSLKKLHGYVHQDKTHHHLRYKICTWLRGLIPNPYMRPPMPTPEREETLVLRDMLKANGLNVISDKEIDAGLNNPPKDLRKPRLKAIA